MLLCFGWVQIQTSHEGYIGLDPIGNLADILDDHIEQNDQKLFDDLECWIRENADDWLRWKFTRALNNHTGLLQFHTSRNHRNGSCIWTFIAFIAAQSKGSHGLIYIHDDEDIRATLSYKIWRILDGEVTEHNDPFFSPFNSAHAFGRESDVWLEN